MFESNSSVPGCTVKRCLQTARIIGWSIAALGLCVLAGWLLDLDILKSGLPGAPNMKPNTAIGLVLCGLAMVLGAAEGPPTLATTGRLLASIAGAIGLFTLFQYVSGIELGIDQLLLADRSSTAYPGRMAPATALALVGMAAAMGLRDRGDRRFLLFQAFLLVPFTLGALGLVGYALDFHFLYGWGTNVAAMAINTAAAFVALSLGAVLTFPRDGLAGMIASERMGGAFARRALPVALLIPVAIAWARIKGEQLGWYDVQFGIMIMMLSAIIVFSVLILFSARRLNRHDEQLRASNALLETRVAERTVELEAAISRLRAETVLREAADAARQISEIRFRNALEFAPIGMAIVGIDGHWIEVNRAFCEIVGYDEQALHELTFQDITHPDDLDADLAELHRLLDGKIPSYQMEKRYIHKNGSGVWVMLSVSLVRDNANQPAYFVSQIEDISTRKKAAQDVEASRRLLTEVIAALPVPFALKTDDSRWLMINESMARYSGKPAADLVGKTDRELFGPALAIAYRDEDERAKASEGPIEIDGVNVTASGEKRWVLKHKRGIHLPDGTRLVAVTVTDISEHRRTEERLRESEERFRSLTALSADWYWEQDENFRFTMMSGGVLKKFGFTPESFVGKSRWEFPINVDPEVLTAHKALLAERQPFSDLVYSRTNPDGQVAYVSTSGVPIRDESGTFLGYRGIGRDVTEQKLAQDILQTSEKRLRLMVENLPAGAVYVAGESIFLNSKVEQITGYKREELPTLAAWFAALYPGQHEQARAYYEGVKAARFPEISVIPIIRKDGASRLIEFAAYRDDSGELWTLNDVTERVSAEEKYRVLFEHSSDAHVLFDNSGIIDCNNAALAMIGATDKQQLLGRHPALFSPEHQPDGRLSREKAIEIDVIARQKGVHRFEWMRRRLDGIEFPVEVTLTPMTLSGGLVMFSVWHDLTARKRAEAEILQTRERLNLALVGSKLAFFEWNLESGEAFLSERWGEMLGTEIAEIRTTFKELEALVHPDDLDQQRAVIRDLLTGNSRFYQAEHRVRTHSGDYIWVQSHGQVAERNAAGRVVRVVGTNADITHRKHAEEELKEAHAKLGSGVKVLEQRNREITLLAELSNFLTSCVTVEEACTAIPKYCETLFPHEHGALYLFRASRDHLNPYASWGSPRDEILPFKPEDCWALRRGRPHTVFDPQKDAVCGHIAAHYKAESHMCIPLVVQSDLMGLMWITLANPESSGVETDATKNGKQQLAVTLSEQIALALSNIRLRENLRQQTIRDALTGLYNRRFLEESLNREIARCKRNGTVFGVLMIDVDHFKRFNDTFGHDAGDGVLREVARGLQENTREGDIVCRFGGEEFIVVLPDTDRRGAATRAGRILCVVRDLHVTHNDKTLGSITTSIGLAMYPQNGETVKALIQSADQALYAAKGAGRDRLVEAGE